MSNDGVSYAFIEDKSCLLRLTGAIKCTNVAADFEKFIDSFVDHKDIHDVIIDMRECSYIDSTDLGLLARIAIAQKQKMAADPVILYEEGSDISVILQDIGLSRVFNMVTELEMEDMDLTEIEQGAQKDQLSIAKLMLDAHKQLVDLDDSNTEKFGAVINYIEQNVKTLEEAEKKEEDGKL